MISFSNQRGAEELLKRIKSYWAERGHDVEGVVVNCGFDEKMRESRFEVRTNLVDGVPREGARMTA